MIKSLYSISKIRIEFHQVQQCVSNTIKPLHVSSNDGHHRKATNTSKEMLRIHILYTCGLVWVILVFKIVKIDLLKLITFLIY
jgi:hypothetical protein